MNSDQEIIHSLIQHDINDINISQLQFDANFFNDLQEVCKKVINDESIKDEYVINFGRNVGKLFNIIDSDKLFELYTWQNLGGLAGYYGKNANGDKIKLFLIA